MSVMLKSFQEAFFLNVIDILTNENEVPESSNGLIPVSFFGSIASWVLLGPDFLIKLVEPFVNVRIEV